MASEVSHASLHMRTWTGVSELPVLASPPGSRASLPLVYGFAGTKKARLGGRKVAGSGDCKEASVGEAKDAGFGGARGANVGGAKDASSGGDTETETAKAGLRTVALRRSPSGSGHPPMLHVSRWDTGPT